MSSRRSVSERVPLITREDFLKAFPTGVRGQESVALDAEYAVIECPPEGDMARQEYKESADLRYQVERFGVGVHQPVYGESHTDLDLTQAFQLVERAQGAWLALPAVVRQRYANWREVEAAALSGELEQVIRTAGVPAGSSGGAPAVPPSDSAADGAP